MYGNRGKSWAGLVLVLLVAPLTAGPSQVGGRLAPDGSEPLTIDLPSGEHLKNTGGRDGKGLCVFTSVEHSGRWQNEPALVGFQQKMRQEPGGGWPEKLDQMLAKHAPSVRCVQYSGNDPGILKLALRTGRLPAVTYGYSPRYGGPIAHMVNLAHLTERWACVLDNNFPGEDRYEWMPPDEFLRRWKMGGGGWAVVLLRPAPPPIPVNGSQGSGVRSQEVEAGPPCPGGVCLPIVTPSSRHPITPSDGPPCSPACTCGCRQGKDCSCTGWKAPVQGEPGRVSAGSPAEAEVQDFGVDRSKLPALVEGEVYYAINGRRVSRQDAWRAVQGSDGLEDDSQKLRLTLVGAEAECQRVVQDVERAPELTAWRSRLLVQAYRPTAWALTGVGFPTRGRPTIVVQSAADAAGKGRVLHAQHDYEDGPAGLAKALRQADPSYDPRGDPDLRRLPLPLVPQPPPAPAPVLPDDLKQALWALLTGVGLLVLRQFSPPLASLVQRLLDAFRKSPESEGRNRRSR